MNSTTKTTKETIELQIRASLIEAQIKIARMNNYSITTIAFPNSTKITDTDIVAVLKDILYCSEPEILNKQTLSTVGVCTISLWTLKID